MSKMPPMATSGKLVHAGKRKHACQVLKSEQRQHDRRDLLSSLGKNSALAVVAPPPPHTPSGHNERYAARVASTEKPRSVHLSAAGSTDMYAHSISDVAEKIVFDGDGGKSKSPPFAELVSIAKHVVGEEDESDELPRSSGSSGGGERMRKECAAKDVAEAIVILPVPKEIIKAVHDVLPLVIIEVVHDVLPSSLPPQMRCNTSLAMLTDSVPLLMNN